MHILFVGQYGIPPLKSMRFGGPARPTNNLQRGHDASIIEPEVRVTALAERLASDGHDVAVTCAQPFISRHMRRYNGVELIHLWSLNPNKPGGWVHALLELITVWRQQPDAVHVHGWRMATLAPIAAWFSPASTLVWTIDTIASEYPRWLIRWVASVFDVVVAPSRELQYQLLQQLQLRVGYLPDGYTPNVLPELPLRDWHLRKGQYCVTTAQSAKDIRFVAAAYAKSGTRKKLVVFKDERGSYKRLAREYKLLQFVSGQSGRVVSTIIANAASVIMTGSDTPLAVVLLTMDSGRAIVATTEPYFEETLGVSARFVKAGDVASLTEALAGVVTDSQAQAAWGRKARARARTHFRWSRIVPEYIKMYHWRQMRHVPLDSVRASFAKGVVQSV